MLRRYNRNHILLPKEEYFIHTVVLNNNEGTNVPSQLDLKASVQRAIKTGLNPLFGIHDVVITDSLPRTASNKIMRRLLRDSYVDSTGASLT